MPLQVLKNILTFVNLVPGVPASQPHRLARGGNAEKPNLLALSAAGFTVVADEVDITVTRTVGPANVDIYVELWHSIEDSEPQPSGINPALFPFVIEPGAGGGGGGITQLTQDVLAGPGVGPQAATVVGLQTRAVANTAPTAGQVLTWNNVASQWEPTTPAAGGITELTGDVVAGPGSGSVGSIVAGIEGIPVDATPPVNGDVLTYNGVWWTPAAPVATGVTAVTATAPLSSTGGATPDISLATAMGGDTSGNYPNPTVVALQGSPVSPLVPGMSNVLTWNGAAWAPSPLPAVGTLPRLGNTLVVDAVNGNDGTGAVNGLPFLTVEGAINYINVNTLTGVTVWILPGTYALSAGITIPATCSLRGLSTQTTRITLAGSNPGGTVTMITMGANTRIEDVTMTLTSTDPTTNLVGVNTPGSTSITAKLRTCVLTVDNRTVPTGSTTDVYGILDNGSGTLGPASFSFNFTRGVTVNVYSNGGGNKRAVLVATANDISFRDTNFYVAAPTDPASTGSYVGVETTDNNASAQFRTSSIRGAPTTGGYTGSDVLQTLPLVGATPGLGIQAGPGCDFVTRTAGGRAMTTYITPAVLNYSLRGNAPSNPRYFWQGNQTTLDTTEVFYRFQQRAILFGVFVNMRTAPGIGANLQFVVKKSTTSVPGSGVATVMAVTVSGLALTGSKYDASVDFGVGEFMSLELIPSGGNTAADIVVELDIF